MSVIIRSVEFRFDMQLLGNLEWSNSKYRFNLLLVAVSLQILFAW